jgi:hypothetical protein
MPGSDLAPPEPRRRALLCLTFVPTRMKSVTPLILVGTVAFCLLGPYSYLAGAFALDFGGALYGWPGVFVAVGSGQRIFYPRGGLSLSAAKASRARNQGSA